MREIIFKIHEFSGRDEIHDFFQEAFSLPDWYGRNLDALFDVLTEVREETKVVVDLGGLERQDLGGYARQLLRVLWDAAKENERILVEVRA